MATGQLASEMAGHAARVAELGEGGLVAVYLASWCDAPGDAIIVGAERAAIAGRRTTDAGQTVAVVGRERPAH